MCCDDAFLLSMNAWRCVTERLRSNVCDCDFKIVEAGTCSHYKCAYVMPAVDLLDLWASKRQRTLAIERDFKQCEEL